MENLINNHKGMYRELFTALSLDADSKLIFMGEKSGKALKGYHTVQIKPYVEDPWEFAASFMLFLSRVIAKIETIMKAGHTIQSHPIALSMVQAG